MKRLLRLARDATPGVIATLLRSRTVRLLARLACGLALVPGLVDVRAGERAMVRFACPLDGVEFEAMQDFSGFAAGQRLDLKKLGAISQPPALAKCPRCGFPLYTKHPDAAEVARLREIVTGARFRAEALPARPWFALAILREELRADPFQIGWTYLNASWEAEEEAGDYPLAAERALTWFDRAADALRKDRGRTKDRLTARYLGVELCRRLGLFDEARQRLNRLSGASDAALPWLACALEAQASLIAAREAAPDDGRTDLPRPPR